EYLNSQGILVPRQQFKLTKQSLEKIFSEIKIKPDTIIVNGDLKHEFGVISKQEWREALEIFDLLARHCKKVVLIKGNHDTILEPLARRKKLQVMDFYCKGEICFTHGHKIFKDREFEKSKIMIIGNEHPAISIREGVKSELYKCFLLGSWNGKKLVVVPSFLLIIEGSDLRREQVMSPYLNQHLGKFEVFIVGDRIYRFGRLKDIK
ncbi:MAG: metallophosphoesterase, partial [Nanoarchaeota archaeon]